MPKKIQRKKTQIPLSSRTSRVRQARLALGMSQIELAKVAGIDVCYLSRLEHGVCPGGKKIRKQLSRILAWDQEALFSSVEEKGSEK